MRTPVWESTPGALAALLNGTSATQLRMLDLYTIEATSGTVLRYSGGDEEAALAGGTWLLGPVLKRGRTRLSSTLEVDSLEITISAPDSVMVGASPLIHYITAGGLDGAHVTLWRAFSAGPGADWSGALSMFAGSVGEVSGGRAEKRISVRSDIDLLNAKVPRNVYQPGCLNNVYDAACGVARSAHQTTGTATAAAAANVSTFAHSHGAAADGLWALGEVMFTTGANAGVRRTVSSNTSANITVIEPWPFAIAAGDAFTAWAGCNRTRDTCISKFSNLGRYRGMPFIPIAETVL